jgi:predicted secreted protein
MTEVILFIMRIVLFCPNPISGYFWELSNPRTVQWRKEENTATLRSGASFVRKNITVKT